MALEVLLAGKLVNHATHLVINSDEFVNTGTAGEAAVRTFARVIQRRWIRRVDTKKFALIFARCVRHFGRIVEYANQSLCEYADKAGCKQEGFDTHIAQSSDRAGGRVRMQCR